MQQPPTAHPDPSRFANLPPLLPHVPLAPMRYEPPGGDSPEAAARAFFDVMNKRRTVRMFSDRPVSRATIEWCVRAGGTAPSGAHKQPWRFVCISDPSLKSRIRAAAEAEEREFYERRASRTWLEDLAPLGTDTNKPFLETAPWLIAVFQLVKTDPPHGPGHSEMVYYREESVGIAVGMLLSAIHHAGLVALTHTPSPMGFLKEVLGRPEHERAFVLIPVGYPAEDCVVPDLKRKPLEEIAVFREPVRGD
ncbi:MAG: nitroreductase family protein [Phycisphaerales bacterium]